MRFKKNDPNLKKFYHENGYAIITDLADSSNFLGLKETMNYIFTTAFEKHSIPNDTKWPEDDEGTGGTLTKILLVITVLILIVSLIIIYT